MKRPKFDTRRLFTAAFGSLLAGLAALVAIMTAIVVDDVSRGYGQYGEYGTDRALFYLWALRYPAMTGAITASVTYFFLPQVFRYLTQEPSISVTLRRYADSLADQEADRTELMGQLNDLANQAERNNL